MLAPVVHILPLTTLRRERRLPMPGRITVRLDQKVSATDIVGEAHFAQEHILLDVARGFGVSVDLAKKLIVVKEGDEVTEGQVIAEKPGLVAQTMKAPRNGRVALVGGGRVLLETGKGVFELRAGVPGVVSRIESERGVEITFCGAVVQGVWGNGRLDMGIMHTLLKIPTDVLTPDQVDVSLRGFILLGGHVESAAVLQNAAEVPVRGLILSSMAPALLPFAAQLPLPVILTDGLGRRPMNAAAFKLLTTNTKREVAINAEPYDRYRGIRPEVLIPLPVTQEPPQAREIEVLAPDLQVRICRAPHLGMLGTIVAVRREPVALPSGLRAPAVEVRLENGEQALVPLVNLEVVG